MIFLFPIVYQAPVSGVQNWYQGLGCSAQSLEVHGLFRAGGGAAASEC